MASTHPPAVIRSDMDFAEEQLRTAECLADVQQFLSHDTSPTRMQLAQTLRLRADVIEAEIKIGRNRKSPRLGE